MPRVTVLMAVYNGERFLREAVESVLKQTYRDFEFLIVDDGSTDRSREILAAYVDRRIKLLVNERNQGLAAALNRGLQAASGEFIARQDADDRSHPRRLERQLAAMQADPAVGLLGTQANLIDEHGSRIGTVRRPQEHVSIRWFHLFDNPFIHSSVLLKRTIVLGDARGYDGSFPYGQDYELWSRIVRTYPTCNLAECLVDYRSHEASRTGPAHQSVPIHQRTPEYLDWLHRLIRNNFAGIYHEPCSQQEAELIGGFLVGLGGKALGTFLNLFDRLLGSYRVRYPEAASSKDFQCTVARQYEAVATRLTPASRRGALEVYRAALSHDPSLGAYVSWPRFLGLVVLGKSGLAHLKSLRNSWKAVPA